MIGVWFGVVLGGGGCAASFITRAWRAGLGNCIGGDGFVYDVSGRVDGVM